MGPNHSNRISQSTVAATIAAPIRTQWAPLAGLPEPDWQHLCSLAAGFLADKRVVGANGFLVTDEVRWTIALLACLPVLHLGIGPYRDFVDIIVYPDSFIVDRESIDQAGVVHNSREALSGEAMDLGPVVLAWREIECSRNSPDYNVVIHEFVHKLDMANGEADGVPIGARRRVAEWEQTIALAWEQFCRQLEQVERAIPPDVDPESAEAASWYDELALDPYAATDRAEFFAVAGEAYFCAPRRLEQAFPRLFDAMRRYFGGASSRIRPETAS